ncbi:helix-turn-helix domain-containing protein [Clostridioides difficile]|uniref:helix-turn-helix domain-containing protein n=3 Tax=Clostridioides difficile TaxID=1496 RepID=UPI001C17E505|nr:helix-turn-helix domain-containing protein [Clostridioides difficile]MDW0108326.1 helix-turn-helix domain-containing protein [Clostridioides difficile]HBE8645855.1 helix-turn-helix domain-containing protein [Clostridioides difficile]HBF3218266.1 helix-turn-helix domain-containing protein [Clostridioides difficile]HBF4158499.1 helix-turn-helix domain-containing protein [Clostridioides difficile]
MDLLKDARKKEWFWLENEVIDNSSLSMHEKMAYITLARYADNESICFPSNATIAKKMGCSINTARKAIKNLEEKQLIKKIPRKKNEKENDSNLYCVMSLRGMSRDDIPIAPDDKGVCQEMIYPIAPDDKGVCQEMIYPIAPDDKGVCQEMIGKKTYNKKTYIKSNTTTQKESKTDYLDLSFLDLDIEKVKLTKDEYDKLISRFGKKYIHDKIVSLENYIVNGKGSRYKSHYRALLTWGNGDASKGIVPEVTKTKNPLSGFKEL